MAVKQKYPWARWLSRKKITLKKGVDYYCQPHSMSVMLRNHATALGLSIHVFINGNVITIERRK